MTKKRIALGAVTAVSTFIIPIAAVVSCGDKQEMGKTALLMDKTTNLKTNSFSRGILTGIKGADATGFATNVKEDTTSSHADKIKELKARGVKNFVLGSFAMDPEKISKVLGENKTPNLISVDQDKSSTTNKHIASVSAKAQEGAFLGGYLVAKHMHSPEFKSKQAFQDGKLKFGYVFGYRFSSVTDFLYGIINGMKYYEKVNKISQKDAIEIIGGNGHDKDFFAQAWNSADTKYQTVWNRLISNKPDVVIGSPENAIKFNKTKSGNKLPWIGTDIDATKQFPLSKDQVLLSIRKHIGIGVAKVLETLKKNNFDMTKLNKKERFFKGGIADGTMDLTGGIISQKDINDIYKPSTGAWKNALDVKVNDVTQVPE
ncbi:BMP family ABC transporter substrate-binding protein [Mycoplasma todarodis]|uniref:BMP family ABC transporter substrate-binding protein n=1 Tax=Mycoplasma todarodis TaxID=1937191 RepID=UPI003B2D0C85